MKINFCILLLGIATAVFAAGADEKPRVALMPCGDQKAGDIVAWMKSALSQGDHARSP